MINPRSKRNLPNEAVAAASPEFTISATLIRLFKVIAKSQDLGISNIRVKDHKYFITVLWTFEELTFINGCYHKTFMISFEPEVYRKNVDVEFSLKIMEEFLYKVEKTQQETKVKESLKLSAFNKLTDEECAALGIKKPKLPSTETEDFDCDYDERPCFAAAKTKKF